MSLSELIIVAFLSGFDWCMNLITGGKWGRVRGAQRVIVKIRK